MDDDLFGCSFNDDPTTMTIEIEDLPLFTGNDKLRMRAQKAGEEFAAFHWSPSDGCCDWTIIVQHQRTGRRFSVEITIEVEPSYYADAREIASVGTTSGQAA